MRARRRSWWVGPLVVGLLSACQPWRRPDPLLCDPEPPTDGAVHIQLLACMDQIPEGGEGRPGADLYVATPFFRAVLRHPQDALTLSGVGGLTLLDLALWGQADALHEVSPLVGDGWMAIHDWSVGEDHITVSGVVRALPDAPADAGRQATVTWRFHADRPLIEVDGAEGWYLHGRGDVERVGATLARSNDALVPEGPLLHDLGGALRVGPGPLWFDRPGQVWSWLGTQRIAGSSEGDVALWSDGAMVGRLPGGALDTTVPDAIDGVQAVHPERGPSPLTDPSTELQLSLGPAASVDVLVPPVVPRMKVVWDHEDGRHGELTLPTDGGRVGVGAGAVTLTVSAGPRFTPVRRELTLAEGDTLPLQLTLSPRFEASTWAAVALAWPADRSRSWRGTDIQALQAAQAAGYQYVAQLAEDDTTEFGEDGSGLAQLVGHGGWRGRGDGWWVEAWPVRFSDKKNAHGTVQYPVDDPALALQLAEGGADRLRNLRVDLATLSMLGAPHAPDTAPHLVELPAPDPDLLQWAPWFRWLDAARPVIPTAEVTWARAADPEALTTAEIDAALRRGDVIAGTGPRVEIDVDGLRPGDVAPAPTPQGTADTSSTTDTGGTGAPRPPRLTVAHITPGLDRLLVVGDGGAILAELAPTPQTVELPDDLRWVLVAGIGPEDWAVTGPIWLHPPR